MTQNPYLAPNPHDPRWQQAPSIAFPVIVGGLVSALVHAIGLLETQLFIGACVCCGLTGTPGGLVAALMAARADRTVRWGKGFLVAFMACLLGAVIVAVIIAVRGFELPADVVNDLLRSMEEEMKREGRSDAEIQAVREGLPVAMKAVPYVVLAGSVIVGGLIGMLVAGLMNRPPPAPPGYGYPEYGGPGPQGGGGPGAPQ